MLQIQKNECNMMTPTGRDYLEVLIGNVGSRMKLLEDELVQWVSILVAGRNWVDITKNVDLKNEIPDALLEGETSCTEKSITLIDDLRIF